MGKNEDGSVSKLSKRHGSTSFEGLVAEGYLPQVITNYIALLGWAPKDNQEIFSLAELEQAGKLTAVVTQNIDGLHQAAGSQTVYELHGSTLRNYCMKCKTKYPVDFLWDTTGVPRCPVCGGIVRPDVVLYEEGLDADVLSGAIHAIQQADMLIIGGTSLVVYPAAGLINYYNGHKLVLINKSATGMDSRADLAIHAPIGEVFSQITVD